MFQLPPLHEQLQVLNKHVSTLHDNTCMHCMSVVAVLGMLSSSLDSRPQVERKGISSRPAAWFEANPAHLFCARCGNMRSNDHLDSRDTFIGTIMYWSMKCQMCTVILFKPDVTALTLNCYTHTHTHMRIHMCAHPHPHTLMHTHTHSHTSGILHSSLSCGSGSSSNTSRTAPPNQPSLGNKEINLCSVKCLWCNYTIISSLCSHLIALTIVDSLTTSPRPMLISTDFCKRDLSTISCKCVNSSSRRFMI